MADPPEENFFPAGCNTPVEDQSDPTEESPVEETDNETEEAEQMTLKQPEFTVSKSTINDLPSTAVQSIHIENEGPVEVEDQVFVWREEVSPSGTKLRTKSKYRKENGLNGKAKGRGSLSKAAISPVKGRTPKSIGGIGKRKMIPSKRIIRSRTKGLSKVMSKKGPQSQPRSIGNGYINPQTKVPSKRSSPQIPQRRSSPALTGGKTSGTAKSRVKVSKSKLLPARSKEGNSQGKYSK